MRALSFRLRPQTGFGTALKGDTLFGQICWAVRNRFGETRLQALLEGYTANRPFAVVSDAFPAGYLPRPSLPLAYFKEIPGDDRKIIKKRLWMPVEILNAPIAEWLGASKTSDEVGKIRTRIQPHNSIDRRSGTTGEGFAPYGVHQMWFASGAQLDCYLLFDDTRLSQTELEQVIGDIGLFGYGRDASIGLGKFSLEAVEAASFPLPAEANASLTLAPSAPQGAGFDASQSYYQPFTRFGRHGDRAVQTGKPFKTPLLLAQTGAVFRPLPDTQAYIGQGLGGDGTLSKAIAETVHQGYAPIIPIVLPNLREAEA